MKKSEPASRLRTVDQVIEAIGGTAAAGKIADLTPQQISNARAAGQFPANTFLVFSMALARIGMSASPALWRMKTPNSKKGSEYQHEPNSARA